MQRVLDRLHAGMRKPCSAWEDAKGCRSNLAKAEGLKLPSPRDLQYNTTAACLRDSVIFLLLAPVIVMT